LKRTSKHLKDFFFFLQKRLDSNSERLDDLMKDWFEGDFKNLDVIFFFNERPKSSSERLDDLMKDWFEGDFKNIERFLDLQRKT